MLLAPIPKSETQDGQLFPARPAQSLLPQAYLPNFQPQTRPTLTQMADPSMGASFSAVNMKFTLHMSACSLSHSSLLVAPPVVGSIRTGGDLRFCSSGRTGETMDA